MNNFQFQTEDANKLSIASIARLNKLLQALEDTTGDYNESWVQNYRGEKPNRNWRPLRAGDFLEPLVVSADYSDNAKILITSIKAALQRLASRHNPTWQGGQLDEDDTQRGHANDVKWCFGSVLYLLGQQPFLRGEIELRKNEPICWDISEAVAQYLVTVPGTSNQINREIHGHWGYHYHYLDAQNRRSDTLLTFDSNTASANSPTLCWEKHSEKGHFKAQAGKWRGEKRESVYSVCEPNLKGIAIKEFKLPSLKAEPVWPLPINSLATPHQSLGRPIDSKTSKNSARHL